MTLTMPNTTTPEQEQEQSFEQFMIEYVNAHHDQPTRDLVTAMLHQHLHPLSFSVRDGNEETIYALFPQN